MNDFKKIFRFLSSVLFYSVLAVLVIVVFMFLAYFVDQKIGNSKGEKRGPLFGAYVIISESMIPSINVYDAVVTVRVKQDHIKINDIITFINSEIETAGTPITHRVIGIVETEDGIKYRTKGDHNNTEDFALTSPSDVIGKVYLRIPMIGYIQIFMTKPIGWLLVIVLPCLFIIGSDLLRLIGITKKDKNSSQDQSPIVLDSLEIPSNSNQNMAPNNINQTTPLNVTQNTVFSSSVVPSQSSLNAPQQEQTNISPLPNDSENNQAASVVPSQSSSNIPQQEQTNISPLPNDSENSQASSEQQIL